MPSTSTKFTSNTSDQTTQVITLPDIPELFNADFLDVLLPTTPESFEMVAESEARTGPTNPMMEALKNNPLGYTQNMAMTYTSTGSPVLDAFQLLSQHASQSEINKYLSESWKEDPSLTLKVIWNIRSIHDGKGDKELFYRAFGWLYDNHPRTAIANLPMLVEPACKAPKYKRDVEGLCHGYWKDLLNILCLATRGELHTQDPLFLHTERPLWTYPGMKKQGKPIDPWTYKTQRVEQRRNAYWQLAERFEDPKYRALYVQVARMFAERLEKDVRVLKELEGVHDHKDRDVLLRKISLAGKWAPCPGGSHDSVCNISTAISRLIYRSNVYGFTPKALTKPVGPKEEALVLRSVYQRWVLTELRKLIRIPEPLMTSNRWKEIKYSRVASKCMDQNNHLFYKHDRAGFKEYLLSVESRKSNISGATLMPHELVAKVMEDNVSGKYSESLEWEDRQELANIQRRVVEGQWKTLIKNLEGYGALENCIAICDVSGSMGSIHNGMSKRQVAPIFPAISLSLVLAHLSKPPFNGGFITFSRNPQFVQLDLSRSLYDTVTKMSHAHWEMNTDFNAVFTKLLLPLAIKNKVKPEDMIKRLFVFSDMQFDTAVGRGRGSSWETNYDVIEKAYKDAGYEVPEIVYWDLSTGASFYRTVEVQSDKKGVAMMNGFSPAMLKVFMGEDEEVDEEMEEYDMMEDEVEVDEGARLQEEFTPENVMKKALGKESFSGLKVVD